MSISILNNISSLVAENAVSSTQANLQNTLQQLSTGLRINSGSDDPAGLSIADGLGANIAALNQSSQNATDGIGLLQTADGALSQVNTLLTSAVTSATEAANGGLTVAQSDALQAQFASILSEINQIGSTTNFNGISIFNDNSTNSLTGQQANLTTDSLLTAGSVTTITDSSTGGKFVFTAGADSTIGDLQAAIAAAAGTTLATGTALSLSAGGNVVISNAVAGDSLTVSTNDSVLGSFSPTNPTGDTDNVFTSDGTSSGAASLATTINTLSASSLNLTGANLNLNTTTNAAAALIAITNAINTVAAERGNIGANVNQLTADSNVETAQVQNLTSAQNGVQNANIAQVTSNLSQYNILEQTGFDAISQASQAEQNVLKLIQ